MVSAIPLYRRCNCAFTSQARSIPISWLPGSTGLSRFLTSSKHGPRLFSPNSVEVRFMTRVTIFIVQIIWLALLGVLAVVFFSKRSLIPLPDSFGSVPLAVVWFGALGAVLTSLTGIVEHAHDWDPSYALWHLSRPLVGASLAVVAVLILQAGVRAIGSTPDASATPGPKNLLYYLVAFLVGYREETFRELIKRLVDLILAPAGAGAGPMITALGPNTAAAAGVPVVISGSGFTGTTAVAFGASSAAFNVNTDSQITAHLPQGTAGRVTVTVKGKTGSATASFLYT